MILIGLLVLAAAELWVIVQVAEATSIGLTLLLLVATSVLGMVLVRREGLRTLRRFRVAVSGDAGRPRLADGVMIVLGGGLLLVPGFITDALGLLLVLPLTRAPFRMALTSWITRHTHRPATRRGGAATPDRPADVIEGEVVDDGLRHRDPPL